MFPDLVKRVEQARVEKHEGPLTPFVIGLAVNKLIGFEVLGNVTSDNQR